MRSTNHLVAEELAVLERALGCKIHVTKAQSTSMRLRVRDGGVYLSTPKAQLNLDGLAFIRRELPWLRKHLAIGANLRERQTSQVQLTLCCHDQIPLWGKPTPIQYSPAAPLFEAHDQAIHIQYTGDNPAVARRLLHNGLIGLISKSVMQDVRRISDALGVLPRKVTLKQMRTRWGSLGPNNTMNINLALIFAPRECLHYVVAHELAHVLERNHGPKFWRHVLHAVPDYQRVHRQLQQLHDGLMVASTMVFDHKN